MGGCGDKTTIMILNVDLQCCSSYKKVKKILCKFPQIRNQVYDEKNNTITITVVCCDPEKLRDKLCCKGCGVIKSIEIKKPPKNPPPTPDASPPPREPPVCRMPPRFCCGQCFEGRIGGPCYPVSPSSCYNYYGPCPGPYGYRRVCYVSTCDYYFSDENVTGCSIM